MENENRLSAYERVQIARDSSRPKIEDFINALIEDFTELKGDRLGKEDSGIIGGIGRFHNIPVTIVGHRKGRTLEENIKYNFGMPGPEGYRKALRLMRQAEKFKRPIITFIDTPGAYPGIEAEQNGQSIAIAECIARMSTLKVPILSVITGEGNSGGALALGVADTMIMFENAVYSILSPEGFASILWKDNSKIPEACELIKMTAMDLLKYKIIDKVIEEAEGGIQNDSSTAYKELDKVLYSELMSLSKLSQRVLTKKRYMKYRNMC